MTIEEVHKIEKEVRDIFSKVIEIEKEVDRLQSHWFLKWFTLYKQCVLLETAGRLLDRSQELIDQL